MLYLFIIVVALFGEAFVRGSLIAPRDPAATANNILGSETLFRVGLAGEMLTCACDVALAMILYVLLRPVNRNLALLAAFFRLTFVGIYGVAKLFEIAALAALGGADYLKAFEPGQLHDLAYVSLNVHSLGYGASLLFFGFCCVLFGYLIHQSGYPAQDPRHPSGDRRCGLCGLQFGADAGPGIRCQVPVPLDHAARLRGGVGARAVAHGERGEYPEGERKSTGVRELWTTALRAATEPKR